MADIRHMIQIAAPPAAVYPLVATADGFTRWWAADVTEDKAERQVVLGFFNRSTVYGLQAVELDSPLRAHWRCQTGKEWSGTRLLFELTQRKDQTALRFTHASWDAETDYFTSCNTTWGELMFRLKAAAEGKNPGPLFLADGLGC